MDDGRGYIITDVGGGMAVLDGNHPYAGWTLRFEIQVMRVELVEEGVSPSLTSLFRISSRLRMTP